MREVILKYDDWELFDSDINTDLYMYYYKHKDTFCRMWTDQGKDYWIRFFSSFRTFSQRYGHINLFGALSGHLSDYVDDFFIVLHERCIDATVNQVKQFIEDIVIISSSRVYLKGLEAQSRIKDPFYRKESKDLYCQFFGNPKLRKSYFKVYLLLPLYIKFGGALCVCLRRWMNAPDMDPTNISYWIQPKEQAIPELEICVRGTSSTKNMTKKEKKVLYKKELETGSPAGPVHIKCWPDNRNPITFLSFNPLYNSSATPTEDWRENLQFEDFVKFIDFLTQYKIMMKAAAQCDKKLNHNHNSSSGESKSSERCACVDCHLKEYLETRQSDLCTDENCPYRSMEVVYGLSETLATASAAAGVTSSPKTTKSKVEKGKMKSANSASKKGKGSDIPDPVSQSNSRLAEQLSMALQDIELQGANSTVVKEVTIGGVKVVVRQHKLGANTLMTETSSATAVDKTQKSSASAVDKTQKPSATAVDKTQKCSVSEEAIAVDRTTEDNCRKSDDRVKSLNTDGCVSEAVNTNQSEPAADIISLCLADLSLNSNESKPDTILSLDTNQSKPVTDLSLDTDLSKPVTDLSLDTYQSKPVTDLSLGTNQSKPVADLSRDTNLSKPVTDLSLVTDQSKPVTDLSLDTDLSKPVTDLSLDSNQSKPVTDLVLKSQSTQGAKSCKPKASGSTGSVRKDTAALNKNKNKTKASGSTDSVRKNTAALDKNKTKKSSALHTCGGCGTQELVSRTYKKCKQCKDEGAADPKYYCSRECQASDWLAKHCLDHQTVSRTSAAAACDH